MSDDQQRYVEGAERYGRMAYETGRPVHDNPYRKGSPSWLAWNAGYSKGWIASRCER